MKKAIIETTLKGYAVTIDGVTKNKKGGIMKQMVEIMNLSTNGYEVVDQHGKSLNFC